MLFRISYLPIKHQKRRLLFNIEESGDFGGPAAKTPAPNARCPGSIPEPELGPTCPQLRICTPQ